MRLLLKLIHVGSTSFSVKLVQTDSHRNGLPKELEIFRIELTVSVSFTKQKKKSRENSLNLDELDIFQTPVYSSIGINKLTTDTR